MFCCSSLLPTWDFTIYPLSVLSILASSPAHHPVSGPLSGLTSSLAHHPMSSSDTFYNKSSPPLVHIIFFGLFLMYSLGFFFQAFPQGLKAQMIGRGFHTLRSSSSIVVDFINHLSRRYKISPLRLTEHSPKIIT